MNKDSVKNHLISTGRFLSELMKLSPEFSRAIAFYSGLSNSQREGYPAVLAKMLGIKVSDFLAAVKNSTKPKQQEQIVDSDPQARKLQALAKKIEVALESLQVYGEVTKIALGPRLVSIGFAAESNRLTDIQNEKIITNLAHNLNLEHVRIFSPFLIKNEDCTYYKKSSSNNNIIGIEMPREDSRVIAFSELKMSNRKIMLPLFLGLDVLGRPHVVALEDLPHCLLAGSTGMGKSTLLHSIICGLLFNAKNFRIALIDTKRVDLTAYDSNPELLVDGDIAKTKDDAAMLLQKLEADMRWRYSKLESAGVRNIAEFNESSDKKLPYIVLIVDELADVFFGEKNTPMEDALIKLAQMGRAAGIHAIIATQRPSTDVITGLVKANFPARISLKLPSQIDSRTILDCPGAEKLYGSGDMFFISPKHSGLMRLHAALITDKEIKDALQFYRPKKVYPLPGIRIEKNPLSIRSIMEENRMGFTKARRIWKDMKGDRKR